MLREAESAQVEKIGFMQQSHTHYGFHSERSSDYEDLWDRPATPRDAAHIHPGISHGSDRERVRLCVHTTVLINPDDSIPQRLPKILHDN
jgi:hypothetical protein